MENTASGPELGGDHGVIWMMTGNRETKTSLSPPSGVLILCACVCVCFRAHTGIRVNPTLNSCGKEKSYSDKPRKRFEINIYKILYKYTFINTL
jgi:hypothetical protein